MTGLASHVLNLSPLSAPIISRNELDDRAGRSRRSDGEHLGRHPMTYAVEVRLELRRWKRKDTRYERIEEAEAAAKKVWRTRQMPRVVRVMDDGRGEVVMTWPRNGARKL